MRRDQGSSSTTGPSFGGVSMAPEIKQDTSEPKDGLFFPGKPRPNQAVKTDHSRD